MKKPLIIISCIFFLSAMSACTDKADESPSDPAGLGRPKQSIKRFDSYARADRHPVISNRPAVDFFEGAVLGNGGLGVIVTTRPDAVVLYFGHNDVWDIRLAEANSEKIGTFQEIFERVRAIPDTIGSLTDVEWYREYLAMARENYAKPYPRPFPCGRLVLWFDRRNAELIGHRLNIDNGLCEVNFLIDGEQAHLELFTDMEHDRLWGRMVNGDGDPMPAPFVYITMLPDPKTPTELPKYEVLRKPGDGTLSFRQVLPYEEISDSEPYTAHPKDRAFCLTASMNTAFAHDDSFGKNEKKHYSGSWIPGQSVYGDPLNGILGQSQSFTMCIQLDHGPASETTFDSRDLHEPKAASYTSAAQLSNREWEIFWNKSGIALDDEFLERTWYRNLYFFRCAVRQGATCPGLFANWSFGDIGTAWHGDYHMNYNTQQPFWLTFSSNHTDLHLPYVDMVKDILLPVSKKWAREYYGMRGAFFPHSAYPVEMTMLPYPLPTWGWEVFETPWTVQSLWWHYIYTMDEDFLRNRAFGIIRESVLFLVDYMMRPDAHGDSWGDDNYHIFPSVPPELYGLRPGFDKNYDTTADLALTRFVFDAYIEACTILDREMSESGLIQDVREILAHFPGYPTAQSGKGEVFVSVPGENPEVVYNCPASLMSVFPGEIHGLHSSPRDLEIASNTYRNQQNEGGNDIVFLNISAARLGILDLEKFKRQINYALLPNGTCADKVLQIHGRYTNNTPFDYMAPMGLWLENFALPFVINECLMQSYNGELRLFPNWPDDTGAEFSTLRAAGAFLVSAKWASGSVEWVEVLSEVGSTLTMLSPWESGAVCSRSGVETVLTGERFTLDTSPGEVLRFTGRR
ncbi:glycoside hydrolase N-terminal domain-containing protein [Candidatus Omnitrophota bacterium]